MTLKQALKKYPGKCIIHFVSFGVTYIYHCHDFYYNDREVEDESVRLQKKGKYIHVYLRKEVVK